MISLTLFMFTKFAFGKFEECAQAQHEINNTCEKNDVWVFVLSSGCASKFLFCQRYKLVGI